MLLVLGAAALAACSSSQQGACPQYEIASGVTIDAAPFFTAHAAAYELCADQTHCVSKGSDADAMGFDLATGDQSALILRITVLTRQKTELVNQAVHVTLHQKPAGAACNNNTAFRGSVTVTTKGLISVN